MYSFVISGYGTMPLPTLGLYNWSLTHTSPIKTYSITHPSFVCKHHNLLFTFSEVPNQVPLQLYHLGSDNLNLNDTFTLEGEGICHISYSPKHQTLFGACYQSGHIFSLSIDGEHFDTLQSHIHLTPTSDGISRAHCVQMDVAEKYLYATNLHTDQIYCYQLHDKTLIPNLDYPILNLPKGLGPRHIIFHTLLPIAYVITELSNHILVLKQDTATGKLTVLQTITTLSPDFQGKSYCSNCIITPNGLYLIAANRGENTLAIFNILSDGTLSYQKTFSCHGNWPRHIACTQDGRYLMICNQKSHEIVIMSLNQDLGTLGEVVDVIPFHEPTYIEHL